MIATLFVDAVMAQSEAGSYFSLDKSKCNLFLKTNYDWNEKMANVHSIRITDETFCLFLDMGKFRERPRETVGERG